MQTFIADHVSFVENALHQREEALLGKHQEALLVWDLEALWEDFAHAVDQCEVYDFRLNEGAKDDSSEAMLNAWYEVLTVTLPQAQKLIPRFRKILQDVRYAQYKATTIKDTEIERVSQKISYMQRSAAEWVNWKER